MDALVSSTGPFPLEEIARLAVGVTGHRLERLAGFDLAALRVRLGEVMTAIADAAPATAFRLVGSLAEGADMLAADEALARGWQLDAVLPFRREDYAEDFDRSGSDELESRLRASTNVLELPGNRTETGGETAAYERAGRVVLTQSDLLIAVWDGNPPRGRGGAAQIVAEAVGHGIPVLVIHPDVEQTPVLLWSGLNDHDFGAEAVDTVARGGLSDVPRLMVWLTAAVSGKSPRRKQVARRAGRPLFAIAYPLMLALAGARRFQLADLRRPRPAERVPVEAATPLEARIERNLWPRFETADCDAGLFAQLFRSAFVSNFALAALSVTLSLLGLIVPTPFKPLLVLGEFASIATILLITQLGARAGWHHRWLEQRTLAEELRCLAVSARLGDLFLRRRDDRTDRLAAREVRTIARRIGLPSARIDAAYLAAAHASFLTLLDDQIAYVRREAGRMRLLEHRLHRLGAALFAVTALVCAAVLLIEVLGALLPHTMEEVAHHLPLGITVISASLPAIGAAIYGIRMQGDFAGVAERNAGLAAELIHLRRVALDETPGFDSLRRLIRRAAELLTADVSQWERATRARPLSLPG
jgi:hypothetical protein